MNWVEKLIETYSVYDPGLKIRSVGASLDEIERFEELAGIKAPGEYRLFLETWGKDSAGLLDGIPAYFDIGSLSKYYEIIIEETEAEIWNKYQEGTIDEFQTKYDFFVSRDWLIVAEAFIETNMLLKVSDSALYESAEGVAYDDYCAESFSKFVNQRAYLKYKIESQENRFYYGAAIPSLEAAVGSFDVQLIYGIIESLCSEFGCKRESISDSFTYFASSDTINLWCRIRPTGSLLMLIAGEGSAIDELRNKLVSILNLDSMSGFKITEK